jgi:hypothetical protein
LPTQRAFVRRARALPASHLLSSPPRPRSINIPRSLLCIRPLLPPCSQSAAWEETSSWIRGRVMLRLRGLTVWSSSVEVPEKETECNWESFHWGGLADSFW